MDELRTMGTEHQSSGHNRDSCNPYASARGEHVPSQELRLMFRLGGVLCSTYVYVPALLSVISMLCFLGTLIQGSLQQAVVFLFSTAALGVSGIPIAVLQTKAIFARNARAARAVTIVLTLLSIVIAVAILGSTFRAMDSGFPKAENELRGSSLIIVIAFLAVNSMAALYMRQVSRTYEQLPTDTRLDHEVKNSQ